MTIAMYWVECYGSNSDTKMNDYGVVYDHIRQFSILNFTVTSIFIIFLTKLGSIIKIVVSKGNVTVKIQMKIDNIDKQRL